MNTRKFTNIALSLSLSLITVIGAFAQQQQGPTAIAQGTVVANPNLQVAADLEVKIEVFEESNGAKPIPQGASLPYSGGAPSSYVRFTIKNKGAAKAENFTYKMVVNRDGIKVHDPAAAQITLNPGESKVFPLVKVGLPGTTNEMEAKVLADIGNFVKETNEQNNSMTFKWKASVVH
ncbi:MAG: CARDB domain-containing protein [Blastocatellia bacterium]